MRGLVMRYRLRYMRGLILALVTVLALTLIPHNASGLLVFVGHFVNISAVVGVGLESGEGVLVRANSQGQIKVMGYSPIP